MNILSRIGKQPQKRAVLIGLDGVSCEQLQKLCDLGHLPRIRRIFNSSQISEISQNPPSVSPVSWTNCFTGVNPATHGLFGYMERRRKSYDVYFPNCSQLNASAVWDEVSFAGKTAVSINVPYTYPVGEIRGVLISGFDSLDFNKAVYPVPVGRALEKAGYRVDVDLNLFNSGRERFYADFEYVLDKRCEAVRYLFKRVDWQLFICVLTGTGRLNRYLYHDYMDSASPFHQRFIDYFKKIDGLIGDIDDHLPGDAELIIMSDHATVPVKREVSLNAWLMSRGLLTLKSENHRSFDDIDPFNTKAFALDNGRIYINRNEIMPDGCVASGRAYEKLRNTLIEALLTCTDEAIGTPFISAIYRKEDIYSGPFKDRAPDLVLEGISGYEFNGDMISGPVFSAPKHEGCPSGQGSFFCMKGFKTLHSKPAIFDIYPTILEIMGIPVKRELDGVSIF